MYTEKRVSHGDCGNRKSRKVRFTYGHAYVMNERGGRDRGKRYPPKDQRKGSVNELISEHGPAISRSETETLKVIWSVWVLNIGRNSA